MVLKFLFAVYATDQSYGNCTATSSPLEQVFTPHQYPGLAAEFSEMPPLPSTRSIDKSSHCVESKSQSSDHMKVDVTITTKEGEGPDDTVMGKHSFDRVR